MDSAIASVSYKVNNVNFKREVFASFPDQVIVIQLTADQTAHIRGSKWTTNINTEMNYCSSEVLSLEETNGPLFDLIDDLVVSSASAGIAERLLQSHL